MRSIGTFLLCSLVSFYVLKKPFTCSWYHQKSSVY